MMKGDKILIRWMNGIQVETSTVVNYCMATVIRTSKTQIVVRVDGVTYDRIFRRKADLRNAQYYESVPGGGVTYNTTLCNVNKTQYSEIVQS